MALIEELRAFLGEVEEAIFNISTDLENCSVDVDRVLLTSEWLLRDVILVEEFLPSCDGEDTLLQLVK